MRKLCTAPGRGTGPGCRQRFVPGHYIWGVGYQRPPGGMSRPARPLRRRQQWRPAALFAARSALVSVWGMEIRDIALALFDGRMLRMEMATSEA